MENKIQSLLEREGLELASLKARFLAYVLDYFLVSFLFLFLVWDFVAGVQGDIAESTQIFLQFSPLYILCNLSYEVIFIHFYGATLGKILFKVRVVSVDYVDNPSFLISLVRAILKLIGSNFFYITYIFAFDDAFKRTLHDRLTKTIVISIAHA